MSTQCSFKWRSYEVLWLTKTHKLQWYRHNAGGTVKVTSIKWKTPKKYQIIKQWH